MILRDLSGKTVKTEMGAGPYDTDMVRPGIYIVELQFTTGSAKAFWVKRD